MRTKHGAASAIMDRSRVLAVVSAATVIGVFIVDAITPAEIAVAVLYVGVVLLSARFFQKRGILLVSLGCMTLAVLSYFLSPLETSPSIGLSNRFLSLAAIGVTAFLAVQNQSREMALREQAGLLDLTHDTVFVRDINDVITYWNRGAEELYGWKKGEAVGKTSHQLLQTIFPTPFDEITAELFRTGRWEGELTHTKKDGTQAIVASRWSAQQDTRGRPVGILETNNDITERNRAVEALRKSEEQWREIFEHNPVMYFMVDADGTVLSVNAFGATQLGYKAAELVGKSVLTVFLEEDRKLVSRQVATCLEQVGRSHSWEIRKVRKDGSVLWVRENAKAVRRSHSDLILLVACEDITERKRGEQRVAAQHAVTRVFADADSLAAAAPHLLRAIGEGLEWDWGALWSVDQLGARLRCDTIWHAPKVETAEFDAISRDPPLARGEGRLGRVWQCAESDWMIDLAKDPLNRRASAVAAAGLHAGVAFPILFGGDVLGVIEFYGRAARVRDEDQLATLATIGSQIGLFMKRKRAEAAVQESEKRFRALIEYSYDAIVLLDANYKILYASPAVTRMSGYSPEELIGRTATDFQDPDQRQQQMDLFARVTEKPGNVLFDEPLCIRHKDGSWRWLDAVMGNFLHEPSVQAVVVNLRDVTERKQAEKALQQAQTELGHVTRVTALGELTASIAHEVKQPITGVVTNAEAALRWLGARPADLDEIREALGRIIKDGRRAGDIIDRIRALIKKAPPRKARFDLNEAVLDVTALTRSEVLKHGVLLQTQFATDLAPVEGDRIQLQQVILNLILNAVEAMRGTDAGARELLISTEKDASGGALVTVRDSGPGLNPQSVDRLFEAFYTTKPEGVGMGSGHLPVDHRGARGSAVGYRE